jgi:hypothetical protein
MIVTGRKIDKYREVIKKALQIFPLDQQKEIINNVVLWIGEGENTSLVKRKERMPGLSEQDHQEIIEKRKAMWKHRVEKILGIQNQ